MCLPQWNVFPWRANLGKRTPFSELAVLELLRLLNIPVPMKNTDLTLKKLIITNSPLLLMLSCVDLGGPDELLPVRTDLPCMQFD